MGDPYRSPPGAVVDVKVITVCGDRGAEAEKQLAALLAQGYQLVAHSGCCTDMGTLRLSWTLVRSEADS